METITGEEKIICNKSQLTELFRSGCKQRSDFKIGFEFEKSAVNSKTYEAVPYFGKNGIRNFLQNYKNHKGMDTILSGDNILGLIGENGNITLEPGSQTEFSTIPFKNIDEIASVINEYNTDSAVIGDKLDIVWTGGGIQPVSTFGNIITIPKKRYEIMTGYLPSKGEKALVMMKETAGMQTVIDYESEEDAVNKLKIALAVSPIITAMFANSPVRNGKLTGYKSYRALSWLDTDNDRCGLISKKIFEESFSFSDYAEYLLNVPMFFIERNNVLINMTRFTFREFLTDGFEGFRATPEDWELHMTTVFPEVRLKNYVEIRNCDSQRKDMIFALPALIKGIFYNPEATAEAWNLMKDFNFSGIEELRRQVPKTGLDTVLNGVKLSDLARELVNIAESALLSDPETANEAVYLENLKELTAQGISPADIIIKNMNSSPESNIKNLIEYSRLK